MNILLINPLCRLPYVLPLGLGYIASVLKNDGHQVRILDINGYKYSAQEVEKRITELNFDVAGIGGLTSTYKYVKWLAKIIKKHKPNIPIVAGNMVSTAHPQTLLKNSNVDIGVIDEGELTCSELIKTLKAGGDLTQVNGIVYKNDRGEIFETAPRERIKNLDELPHPAWDLFPMETYLNNSTHSRLSFGLRSINISTVRGCPYDCTFCSRSFGRRVYARSAESIISEIKELKQKYGVQFIIFGDDLSLIGEKRVLEFCDRIISEKIRIKWQAAGRTNLVNAKLLKRVRQAGCVQISYGFESGSQHILDRMKKQVKVAQAEQAVWLTRQAKINVTGSFIIGMPGETRETIEQTLAFIKRTRLPLYRFFYATPYPKTQLYETARQMKRLPENEDKYLEGLGEMRTTFLVNLTNFSDQELVKLKETAEQMAKQSLGFKFKAEEFMEKWLRRYVTLRQHLKQSGPQAALEMVFAKIKQKYGR